MRSTAFSTAAALLATISLVNGQTFTDCDPTKKTCPADPAIGGKLNTDFTKGASKDWQLAAGTTLTYDDTLGAKFTIAKVGQAPTIESEKYIFFGKVEAVIRSAPGTGTVSSFILESDDLDEIDWEWLGSDHVQVQSNFFGKGNTTTYDRGQYHAMTTDPINDFHTYTIDWTAESIKWLINGVVVRTLLYNDPLTHGGYNYPQTPMKIKMGSWIGCASEAAVTDPKTSGTCSWAGGPLDITKGPFVMHVKSVSIEDYGCATEYSYGDKSGSFQSIVSTGGCDGKGSTSSRVSSNTSTATSAKISASSSATSGLQLIETSVSGNASATASGTRAAATTLTTATPTGSSSGSTTRGTATSSSGPAQVTTNAAPSKYGPLNFAVMGLGLVMGYFFM